MTRTADMDDPKQTLVVCDPNLEMEVRARFPASAEGLDCFVWRRGDWQGRRHLQALLRSRRWDLLFSVYNDYIFTAEDLACCRFSLNFHPALPDWPGVGYDILPLIHRAEEHGATLHRMTARIDNGPVYHCERRSLPRGWNYSQLRRANQLLLLSQFQRFLVGWLQSEDLAAFEAELRCLGESAPAWSTAYCSRGRLRRLLRETWKAEPDLARRLELPRDLNPPSHFHAPARLCKSV